LLAALDLLPLELGLFGGDGRLLAGDGILLSLLAGRERGRQGILEIHDGSTRVTTKLGFLRTPQIEEMIGREGLLDHALAEHRRLVALRTSALLELPVGHPARLPLATELQERHAWHGTTRAMSVERRK